MKKQVKYEVYIKMDEDEARELATILHNFAGLVAHPEPKQKEIAQELAGRLDEQLEKIQLERDL